VLSGCLTQIPHPSQHNRLAMTIFILQWDACETQPFIASHSPKPKINLEYNFSQMAGAKRSPILRKSKGD
jgi:hypothetical protein